MAKKIGILGSGAVGQALGSGFLKHGYEVMIGTREPRKLNEWKNKNSQGKTGTFEETAAFGEIVVLAAKGTAADSVLKSAGGRNLEGKVVIDATNPIADTPPQNGVLKYFTTLEESLMERLQKNHPKARFVKAFSCIGSALMVNPDFGGLKPTMFICGNDEAAKSEVKTILDTFGFETEDMGKAEAARAIEPLAIAWCIPGFLRNDWMHAFKLLKK
ncbi:MAG TPA: NAD(P)-binding domain-containing protein [Chitinophagales bacterium]|nr:NAD(P)-binding domain-containing protein [Chitinophagales bacterium]